MSMATYRTKLKLFMEILLGESGRFSKYLSNGIIRVTIWINRVINLLTRVS